VAGIGNLTVSRQPQGTQKTRAISGFLAVAVAVTFALGGKASGAPAWGVPNLSVPHSWCIRYGHRIVVRASGFAPGTSVVFSAPLAHYAPPGVSSKIQIESSTVAADEFGKASSSLKAPHFSWTRFAHELRVVFATGMAQNGSGETQTFEEVVIGTPAFCRWFSRHGQT
jgi:hypothetical protein